MIKRARSIILLAALLACGATAFLWLRPAAKATFARIEQSKLPIKNASWHEWSKLHENASNERIMQLQQWTDQLPQLPPGCSALEQLSKRAELQKNIEDLILLTRATNHPWFVQLQTNMGWIIALLGFVAGLLFKRRQ